MLEKIVDVDMNWLLSLREERHRFEPDSTLQSWVVAELVDFSTWIWATNWSSGLDVARSKIWFGVHHVEAEGEIVGVFDNCS
jgi:hypothetical protein